LLDCTEVIVAVVVVWCSLGGLTWKIARPVPVANNNDDDSR